MVTVNEKGCPKNHRCPVMNICPTGAIVQRSPYEAPTIIEDKCIDCGKCARSCGVFKMAN